MIIRIREKQIDRCQLSTQHSLLVNHKTYRFGRLQVNIYLQGI